MLLLLLHPTERYCPEPFNLFIYTQRVTARVQLQECLVKWVEWCPVLTLRAYEWDHIWEKKVFADIVKVRTLR